MNNSQSLAFVAELQWPASLTMFIMSFCVSVTSENYTKNFALLESTL